MAIGVRNTAFNNLVYTCAAYTIVATIWQGHALAPGGIQYAFPGFYEKAFTTVLDGYFVTHCNDLCRFL